MTLRFRPQAIANIPTLERLSILDWGSINDYKSISTSDSIFQLFCKISARQHSELAQLQKER